MTNTERIQTNNAELREAIQMAENLPDAGGGGSVVNPIIEPLEVTKNGTYTAPDGVDGYSPVVVDVPIPDGYIVPSGTKDITENGTHDVKAYEAVSVDVPIPEGYLKPSGTLEVDENGTHDVTEYASVEVNVPSGGTDILKNITGLYFFFWKNQNMGLLPVLMEMDWSNIKNAQYIFQENTMLTEFIAPESMRISSVHGMFKYCTSVVRVSGLDRAINGVVITDLFNGCSSLVDSGTINFAGVSYATNAFAGCVALEEIRIAGTIGLSVSFANSGLLSDESIQSIIDALADKTGATALTLTLHATVGGKLTAEQKAAITAKNWTLVY